MKIKLLILLNLLTLSEFAQKSVEKSVATSLYIVATSLKKTTYFDLVFTMSLFCDLATTIKVFPSCLKYYLIFRVPGLPSCSKHLVSTQVDY